LSVIFFGAATLAKETAVVLPFLIIFYEYTAGRSSQQPRWGGRLVPYFFVLAGSFGLRAVAIHRVGGGGDVSVPHLLLSFPWLVCVYLKMLFWPATLSPIYDFHYVDHAASLRFFMGVTAILVCLGLLWWAWKRNFRMGAFLGGWFVITLAPGLGAFYY